MDTVAGAGTHSSVLLATMLTTVYDGEVDHDRDLDQRVSAIVYATRLPIPNQMGSNY